MCSVKPVLALLFHKLLILVWFCLPSKARAVFVSIPNLLQGKMTLTKVHEC